MTAGPGQFRTFPSLSCRVDNKKAVQMYAIDASAFLTATSYESISREQVVIDWKVR